MRSIKLSSVCVCVCQYTKIWAHASCGHAISTIDNNKRWLLMLNEKNRWKGEKYVNYSDVLTRQKYAHRKVNKKIWYFHSENVEFCIAFDLRKKERQKLNNVLMDHYSKFNARGNKKIEMKRHANGLLDHARQRSKSPSIDQRVFENAPHWMKVNCIQFLEEKKMKLECKSDSAKSLKDAEKHMRLMCNL